MRLSFDDEESFKDSEVVGSLRFNNFPSDPNSVTQTLQDREVGGSSMPLERNEGVCFNNSPSDPNSLGQVQIDYTPPQLSSEDIDIIAA